MPDPKDNNIVTMPGMPLGDMSQAVREAFGMHTPRVGNDASHSSNGASRKPTPPRAKSSLEIEVIKTKDQDDTSFGVRKISVATIRTSPFQTREIDEDSSIDELARSIEQKGVIQPIIVRLTDSGEIDYAYELVAGERRLQAAKLAGLTEIPAMVYDLGDQEALELSIIENAQRENLNPIEEALAIQQLSADFGMNQSEIAEVLGKSRVAISNSLRLLNLAPEVIEYLKSGELSAGHGRALLSLKDQDSQFKVARRAVSSELSVRRLEALVAQLNEGVEEVELTPEELKALTALERQEAKLKSLLDLEALSLKVDSQGRKRLNLTFETEAAWKRFLSRVRD